MFYLLLRFFLAFAFFLPFFLPRLQALRFTTYITSSG